MKTLPLIGITQGDPSGVGPEVVLKALQKSEIHKICRPVIVGDPQYFKLPKKHRHIPVFSSVKKKYANSSYAALDLATTLCLQRKISAMVTAPVNKKQISMDENISFLGHTEYLKNRCSLFYKKFFHATMLFVGKSTKSKREKLALVTTHLPLKKVSTALSADLLKKTIINVHEGLSSLFMIKNPSMAVLGLNPHAGEEGLLGTEESTYFKKVFSWARSKKMNLEGPFSADSFFSKKWSAFDVTIAIYHDQGLAPFKLANPYAVNVTLGLPMIRTSVDHGVGYDIAHSGEADASSMIEAILLAAQLSARKMTYGSR